MREKFEQLRLYMETLGLGSFDNAMREYYTAEFDHESDMSREQRNSRHSELPDLLAKLRTNAEGWPDWEAHGYQYEIIKSAKAIARAERAACAEVLFEIEKLPAETNGLDSVSLSKAFRPLTKLFQNKV